MAPVPRPIPRFIADASAEGLPYGRWAQLLRETFVAACEPHLAEAGGAPDTVVWFPERAWGGRVYVPASARAAGADNPVEYFGYVSFARAGEGDEPADLKAAADFTDVTAEANPDWQIDLNEEVIGAWRGDGERRGDITLVWGTPLVRGAVAVTAELDGETVDQAPVTEDRFTMVALDAVRGFPDDLYLEVKIWGQRGDALASESLYEESE